MEYVVFILLLTLSTVLAYLIIKLKHNFLLKCLLNLMALLGFGVVMVMSGLKEISLLVYLILLGVTVLGVLMRIITPLFLNLIGSLVARITKQEYTWKKYAQLMKAEQSGNKMYFCILAFTTLKVVLYMILVASFVGLI